MPIYNSGLGASFGVGVEASGTGIGTWVPPTGWYEILDESFQLVPKYLDSTSLKPGQAFQRGVRTSISEYDVNGDLTMECISRGTTTTGSYGMQFWWKYALGSTWTTGVVESGTAYRHVLTPGTKDGMGLSVECGRPSTTSTAAQRFAYSGCKVQKWDFSCSEGQLANLKMTFDGIRESTTGTIVSPVYAAATAQPSIFSFADASTFLIGTGATTTTGGTGTAATGQTTLNGTAAVAHVVKGMTLSGDTPVASARYGLGSSGFKREQLQNGFPILSGTLDAEFTNKTEFYDLFTTNAFRSLQIDFTNYIGGVDAAGATGGTGTTPYRLSFVLPMVKFKTGQVSLNGPDLLTEKISFQAYDDGANPPIQVKLVSTDQAL
jgi:hypothetical protein